MKGVLKWQAADGAYEYEGSFNSENKFHATGSIKNMQASYVNLMACTRANLWMDSSMATGISVR